MASVNAWRLNCQKTVWAWFVQVPKEAQAYASMVNDLIMIAENLTLKYELYNPSLRLDNMSVLYRGYSG